MVKAKRMEEWDKIAWLCFWMPKFTTRKFKPEDFQPMRSNEKSVSISQFMKAMSAVREYLPDNLTNDEIEERWVMRNAKSK